MEIYILTATNDVDQIIPDSIPRADALLAAQDIVREAALRGITLKAVNENGESVFDEDFEILIQFIPHGRRIAAGLLNKMSQDPLSLNLLLSGSPLMTAHVSQAITEYFEKQIAIGKEYLAMSEQKRQRVREVLLNMIAPKTVA